MHRDDSFLASGRERHAHGQRTDRSIGQINGLLRVDFLTDPAN
jgi:hypothetical protein